MRAHGSPAADAGTAPQRTVAPCTLDDGSRPAARLGLVLLSTDQATELAFRAMAPDDVVWFTARLANRNPTTTANLRLMADGLTGAAALLPEDTELGCIAYGCTSGIVALGEAAVFGRIRAVRPGVPCTAPITGALAAFDRLGVRRVALLTPYIEEVDRAMAGYLKARAITVTAMASFDLESDSDMARIPPDDVVRAGLDLGRAAPADALFVSCTALRAWPAIEPLERALGRPVVTSHQALLWHALRLAGCDRPIDGYGRLLRL